MTSIYPSVSQAELIQRRHQLRRQRRIKAIQAIWRSLVVSSLAGSVIWVTTQPDWVISEPEQINIEGNQFLSKPAIRSLLPLSYPQSLLRLQPFALAEVLESKGPIAEATVTRRLLPPALTIQVKERQPVAIALGAPTADSGSALPIKPKPVGLLDSQGVWMPIESYMDLKRPFHLPTLKVIGLTTQNLSYWSQAYQAIGNSPIKILEIDWRNPDNLIIKTELGMVHLGAFSPQFAEQLSVLDQMRKLPEKVNPSQIAYIDLQNPELPSIQMHKGTNSQKTDTYQGRK